MYEVNDVAKEGMDIKIENLEEVLAGLDQTKEYVIKAVNSTCREFKSRAPGWISKAVRNEYTIKDAEIKDALVGAHNVGHVRIGGVKLDDIRLEYSGRRLTPLHFRMSPKEPKISKTKKRQLIPGQYTTAGREVVWAEKTKAKPIMVEIHKGKKKELTPDSGWEGPFLRKVKFRDPDADGYVPFQRKPRQGGGKDHLKSVRTVSIPQMITNETVAKEINKSISEGLAKRLDHHLERYSKA